MRVAVLGGGIAGLTSAYRLSRSGADVTLLEASDRLGGLGTWFEHQGRSLDKFYHVILDSDAHLLKLIDEIGLTDRLHWEETRMGFFVRGKPHPFNSPMDLLRFRALKFRDRIRTGLGALYITKMVKNGVRLDDELAQPWLRRVFGQRVYDCIWDSLLNAKFGELRDRVPAYWVWNTLNREKDGSQEVKGCVRGGYAAIINRLGEAIETQGGEIRLQTPVQGIESVDRGTRLRLPNDGPTFDATVSTLPLPLLHGVAGDGLAERIPLPDLAYQGVVNVLLVLPERLTEYYWTAVVDSDFPFQGVVETTNVIPPEWVGGRHLVYVMNYCSAKSPLYAIDDETLKRQAVEGLARLYPAFTAASVEASFVFRTPHVEPVWTTGYLGQRPAPRLDGTPIYLATTAQAYPMVTSWNTSIKLADDAVTALLNGDSLSAPAVSPARHCTDTDTAASRGHSAQAARSAV